MLDGDRPVTLGEVVSRDGLILAKASGLPHAPTCRLADGRLLPARVVRTNAQNLATVNVEVTGLPAVEWAESDNPGVGTALVVATPAGRSAAGFVSHPPVAIPAERGILWLRVRDAEPGLEAAEVLPDFGQLELRVGDVVRTIEGHTVRGLPYYARLCDPEHSRLSWVEGDRPKFAIERGDAVLFLRPRTGPLSLPQADGRTRRSSGFDRVCKMNMDSTPLLGGPVVEMSGKAAGLAMGWRASGCLLVLPPGGARGIIEKSGPDS